MYRQLYVMLLLLLILICVDNQQTSAQSGKVKSKGNSEILPMDGAVGKGRLPNGLIYYIRHNEEPKDRVVFYLANKVGSILEENDQQGLAHFLEHMNFNGTAHFPKSELVDYLQKTGVRFGADLNAYTSFDETVYQLPMRSDDPVILENGMQIMRDWAKGATLDPDELHKERGIVLEEKRLGKGARERMQRQFWPVVLNQSRYASRIPIGTDEVLNNFKPETIRRFYEDWYRPNLQALIVVGDIDVDQMERAIKSKFSDLKNPVKEKTRDRYRVPLTGKNQFLTVTDKEMTATVLQVIIKHPGDTLKTKEDYRKFVIRELFNSIMNERISDLQRRANPPFLSAGISATELLGGIDQLSIFMEANPGQLETGTKAIWREVSKVKKLGITTVELLRAKKNYLHNMEAALLDSKKVNSEQYVNEYLQHFLKGTAAPGIKYEYGLVEKLLPQIGVQQLNSFIASEIKAKDRDVLLLAPDKDKAKLPPSSTVNGWLTDVEREKPVQYHEDVNTKPFLTTLPSGGKLVNIRTDSTLNLTTVELGNGVKILLKPTNFKDNQILFSGFTPGGSSLYADRDFESAANSAGIISSFGAGNYKQIQLSKYLSAKQLSVRLQMDERASGVKGSATPADFEDALQLLYGYYTQPIKDPELFAGLIAKSKASLENRHNSPNNVFQDSIYAILGDHSIRRSGPSISKIDQIDLDRTFDIYKEQFGDATNSNFFFVGNFEVKPIVPLLVKYLGSLPSSGVSRTAKDLGIHIPAGKLEKSIYKGSENLANVLLVWSGDFEYNAHYVRTMEALQETLKIRLLERLREEESGVYTPSAFLQTEKLPQGRFSLMINFGCSPENVAKLTESAIAEVEALSKKGPSEVNIEKWRAGALRHLETEGKTNEWWLEYLSGQKKDDEDIVSPKIMAERLLSVKSADVKALAERYLDGTNLIKLTLLPEEK